VHGRQRVWCWSDCLMRCVACLIINQQVEKFVRARNMRACIKHRKSGLINNYTFILYIVTTSIICKSNRPQLLSKKWLRDGWWLARNLYPRRDSSLYSFSFGYLQEPVRPVCIIIRHMICDQVAWPGLLRVRARRHCFCLCLRCIMQVRGNSTEGGLTIPIQKCH